MPVAENCWVVPNGMLADDGDTVIETRVEEDDTVRVAVPWTVPKLAVIVTVPADTLVAKPV